MYPELPLKSSAASKSLFWMGLALIGAFSAIVLFGMMPLGLLLPTWQVMTGSLILGNAHLAGIGAALILVAQQLDEDSEDLQKWVRRLYVLAIPAAIGFFLMVPLQTYNGYKLLRIAHGEELQRIGQLQKTLAAIQSAQSEAEFKAAIGQIPGGPTNLGRMTVTLPQAKEVISTRFSGQIKNLINQVDERNAGRWQTSLIGWARSSLISLLYGAGFAEIARFPKARKSLLDSLLSSLPWNRRMRSPPRF